MANVWFAKDTVCKVDLASNVTITTSAVLDSFFSSGTAIEAVMKNVTITEPMRGSNPINLQGTDADGFQNAQMEETPGDGVAEIEGTLILKGDETVEAFFYDAGTTVAGTHTRYRAGLAAIRQLAFMVNLDDSSDELTVTMDNVFIDEKDITISGADGHYEINFSGKCLPRDFHAEFKN